MVHAAGRHDIQITALCDKYALLCEKKFRRKIFETAMDLDLLPIEEVVLVRHTEIVRAEQLTGSAT